MRKIDKTVILSTQYKEWLDKLERNEKPHPADSRTYYNDVVMNLLFCQQSVCAYTEMILCDPSVVKEENWENGRYKVEKPEQLGTLEHFDPRLKKEKYWEWDNLFVIHPKINIIKRDSDVDEILKPDSPSYDPMKILDYDEYTNRFIPNTDIHDNAVRERIDNMLKVLLINHGSVRYERESFLKGVSISIQYGEEPTIDKFFTAYEMVKNRLLT